MSRTGYAMVVDDKKRPREWGVAAAHSLGFDKDKIIEAYWGDHALGLFHALKGKGVQIDLILSDYHMDVTKKQPQCPMNARFSQAVILNGIQLAESIFAVQGAQKFVLTSASMNPEIAAAAKEAGVKLCLFKTRPEDTEVFERYVQSISDYLDAEVAPG